jgi:hypothetical protein
MVSLGSYGVCMSYGAADTARALISDPEFLEGQAAIDTAAAHEHAPGPVVERIELLVFQNDI